MMRTGVSFRPSSKPPAQDAETGSIAPALPRARQDALLPELRSRFVKVLNVPQGYACGLDSPAALLDSLFEHPVVAWLN